MPRMPGRRLQSVQELRPACIQRHDSILRRMRRGDIGHRLGYEHCCSGSKHIPQAVTNRVSAEVGQRLLKQWIAVRLKCGSKSTPCLLRIVGMLESDTIKCCTGSDSTNS